MYRHTGYTSMYCVPMQHTHKTDTDVIKATELNESTTQKEQMMEMAS